MRTVLALAALALVVTGCSTVDRAAILQDLQHCDRDYNVAIGGGGSGLSGPSFTATGHIQCKAIPATMPAAPALMLTPGSFETFTSPDADSIDPIGAAILNPPADPDWSAILNRPATEPLPVRAGAPSPLRAVFAGD